MIHFLLHSYGEFSERMPMRASSWPHFDLLYVHEGHLEIQVEGMGRVSLGPGEGILLFPNTPFSPYGKTSRAKASVQHFSLGDSGVLPPPFDLLAGRSRAAIVRQGLPNKQLEADINRSMSLALAEDSPVLQLMREAVLTLILAELLQTTLPDPKAGKNTEPLIRWAEGQSLANLNVEKLAEKAGITTSGLRRRFLMNLKITPQQYLFNLRMNEAARLLRETAFPIKEIASRVGYGSAVSFHNAFQKTRGEAPGSYRKTNRTVG
ncbi:MAG: helix-turn-helix transcriptional regulator [Akkermansiaceae bacterium]